jgi:hypothetical protein
MGMALMGVGGLIVAIGALLWIGNVSGKFISFPYAGYITMAIGGAIFAFGRKQQAEAAAKAGGS